MKGLGKPSNDLPLIKAFKTKGTLSGPFQRERQEFEDGVLFQKKEIVLFVEDELFQT